MLGISAEPMGSFSAHMKAEIRGVKFAVNHGTQTTGNSLQKALRSQTRKSGIAKSGKHKNGRIKNSLEKAWGIKHYPEKVKLGEFASLEPATYVYSKADRLHDIFATGGQVKASKKWLLIPTDAARNQNLHLNGGKRKGEHNWAMFERAKQKYGSKSMATLIDGDTGVIVTTAARKDGSLRKGKALKKERPVVLFILVKRVTIPKLLNLKSAYDKAANQHVNNILDAWRAYEARKLR